MLGSDRNIKAINLLYVAGVFDKKRVQYLCKDIREKIAVKERHLEKAKVMKEITDSFVEMYIWKDKRFLKN